MASRLVPCVSCSRHIKVGPAACPFCGADTPTNVAARPVVQGRPLSRAALLFAGAAAVTACSSSSTPEAKDSGAKPSDAAQEFDTGQPQPLYGVISDASIPDEAGHPQPAYGVIARDAGLPDDDGGAVAAYGVFVDAGK